MVTINYQKYGDCPFQLRLRLYQEGEVRYISVTKYLMGDIKKHHWNQKKQMFTPGCPYSAENNDFILRFKARYQDAALNWNGSVYGLLESIAQEPAMISTPTVPQFIQFVIAEKTQSKHDDGTLKGTFECYEKCDRRLRDYCKAKRINYDKLLVKEITPGFVDNVFAWIEGRGKRNGKSYVSKMLHSIINIAEREGYLKFEDFKKCQWWKKPIASSQKFHTLSEEQCKAFAQLDLSKIKPNCKLNDLYRDFCLFVLYTGQSSCDAISLKYSDIQNINGISHFVFRRRKIAEKQAVPCSVPINGELSAIMKRWQKQSSDGYIFPIRTKKKLKEQTTNNGDIKHFISRLNYWLKPLGKVLGCSFPLHTYTFRHTAITRYISRGVPIIYVANMMGTSVKNCEQIYYNNHGDIASRNKVLMAMGL